MGIHISKALDRADVKQIDGSFTTVWFTCDPTVESNLAYSVSGEDGNVKLEQRGTDSDVVSTLAEYNLASEQVNTNLIQWTPRVTQFRFVVQNGVKVTINLSAYLEV